jgi:hypothetical protein
MPAFPSSVLKHVLRLLEAPNGPVLEDFPVDAPDIKDQPEQVACPVNFNIKKENLSSTEILLDSFAAEFSQIKTWYDVALSKNKRTTTGVSGLSPEDALEFISSFVSGETDDKKLKETKVSDMLRMVAEDIKAFYFEGVSAQPGQPTDSKTLGDWFWAETYAARVINEVRKISLKDGSKEMGLLGTLLLVPRSQMHRFKD